MVFWEEKEFDDYDSNKFYIQTKQFAVTTFVLVEGTTPLELSNHNRKKTNLKT